MADISVLAYLAGVIDSDGCIQVTKSDWRARNRDMTNASYQAKITVRQVEPEAVDLLHETWPGYRCTTRPYAERGRPLHNWSVHSRAAGRALAELLPHLRIKHEQALNAIEAARLSSLRRKRFEVPTVIEGEPLLTSSEVARRLGKSEDTITQAARLGSVPTVRQGRRWFIPESFVETWRTRPRSPSRDQATSDALEACYRRSKELNRVGI